MPLAGATSNATDRLTLIANIRDVVTQLLKLSKERIVVRSTRFTPILQPGYVVYLSMGGLNIRLKKCKDWSGSCGMRDKRAFYVV